MLGAIIGDIVGSRFEFDNYKGKDFELFTEDCKPTDDSVMTMAVAKALMESNEKYTDLAENAIKYMQQVGRKYIYYGYGIMFRKWILSERPLPYLSWGNGAAMRVSPCAYFADSFEDVAKLSKTVTEITHNHIEGIKGAEATAIAVYMARRKYSKDDIKKYMESYYYKTDFTLDEIRPSYKFDVSCTGTIPVALQAFYESTDFEDAIRNAISIGGDSDTIAAITGSIAEPFYGIPDNIKTTAMRYLDDYQHGIVTEFEEKLKLNS